MQREEIKQLYSKKHLFLVVRNNRGKLSKLGMSTQQNIMKLTKVYGLYPYLLKRKKKVSSLQKCQCHKSQRKAKELSRLKETKEI